MKRSRHRSQVARLTASGAAGERVRPTRPGAVGQRLFDHALPQKPAPQHRGALVVGRPAKTQRARLRVVQEIQGLRAHLQTDSGFRLATEGEGVYLQRMADRLVQEDGGGRRPQQQRTRGDLRRMTVSCAEAGGQRLDDVPHRLVTELRQEPPPAAPAGLDTAAEEGLVLGIGGQIAIDDPYPTSMAAYPDPQGEDEAPSVQLSFNT